MRKVYKTGFLTGGIVLVLVSVYIWWVSSDSYKMWFLQRTLGSLPSSITVKPIYDSGWDIDYFYIFELHHSRQGAEEILTRGFFPGGDPGIELALELVEDKIGITPDKSFRWGLFQRDVNGIKMYYIVPSLEVGPETILTSYLCVFTL